MYPMNRLTLLSILVAGLAWAGDGKVVVGREIFVPDEWNPPEITVGSGGTSATPATPRDFRREFVGSAVNVKSVTVHGGEGRVTLKPLANPVRIRHEETLLEVRHGRDIKLGKEWFKPLGRDGDVLYLQSRKTRQIWRFRVEARREDKRDAREDAAAEKE